MKSIKGRSPSVTNDPLNQGGKAISPSDPMTPPNEIQKKRSLSTTPISNADFKNGRTSPSLTPRAKYDW